MKRIGHTAWVIALGALLAAGCGARTAQSDAGTVRHDAGQQDAARDAPLDAGPPVRDVCIYAGQESLPEDPHYPYLYECPRQMSDPDCVLHGPKEHGSFDGNVSWYYDCRTPP